MSSNPVAFRFSCTSVPHQLIGPARHVGFGTTSTRPDSAPDCTTDRSPVEVISAGLLAYSGGHASGFHLPSLNRSTIRERTTLLRAVTWTYSSCDTSARQRAESGTT